MLALLGLLIAFLAIYVLLPWLTARGLHWIWPSARPWQFSLAFVLMNTLMIVEGTALVFACLSHEEAKELALTGQFDTGEVYGGLAVFIVLADLIGWPVSIWSGLSARRSGIGGIAGKSE